MKILTVVGARPQFIKSALLSRSLRQDFHEVVVHTGQHYDPELSRVFFEQMEIPEPDHYLGVGSGPHGWQTGKMLERLERLALAEGPDLMLVYGDTNSTLAGALVAAKLHLPLAHVEAGLRSGDKSMPEEINRIVADHCSRWLFCPTRSAVRNLAAEGINEGVHLVGDVMLDALLHYHRLAEQKSTILKDLGLKPLGYHLLTVHRPANTDRREVLEQIMHAMEKLSSPVVFPVHPRTTEALQRFRLPLNSNIRTVKPLGYFDMLVLEKHAASIITDSGGMQKEAYWLKVPCITLRDATEWPETLSSGWNRLVGTDIERIVDAAVQPSPGDEGEHPFGEGNASELIRRQFVADTREG